MQVILSQASKRREREAFAQARLAAQQETDDRADLAAGKTTTAKLGAQRRAELESEPQRLSDPRFGFLGVSDYERPDRRVR